jgi:hypothetical protein
MSGVNFHQADPDRSEIAALVDRLEAVLAATPRHHVFSTTVDADLLREAIARLAFMEDESDRLHEDVGRLLRERNAFAEVNAWRNQWMDRAANEMVAALDDNDEGGNRIDPERVQCMEALIAEWWDDGEGDDD